MDTIRLCDVDGNLILIDIQIRSITDGNVVFDSFKWPKNIINLICLGSTPSGLNRFTCPIDDIEIVD